MPSPRGPRPGSPSSVRRCVRTSNGAYVNVPNAGMADWPQAYTDENYARLRRVKAKYDPTNIFQFPQSIPGDGPG